MTLLLQRMGLSGAMVLAPVYMPLGIGYKPLYQASQGRQLRSNMFKSHEKPARFILPHGDEPAVNVKVAD